MSNTSATGGYLNQSSSGGFPGGISFQQFLQTALVGISGFPATLVRPTWQVEQAPQPLPSTNWMAFSLLNTRLDTNAYVSTDLNGVTTLKRNQVFELSLLFYGPNAFENAQVVLDGFQITQNLEALNSARISYRECGEIIHTPDLVNGKWIDRTQVSVYLTREVLRVYPILSFLSASGTIQTDGTNAQTVGFSF